MSPTPRAAVLVGAVALTVLVLPIPLVLLAELVVAAATVTDALPRAPGAASSSARRPRISTAAFRPQLRLVPVEATGPRPAAPARSARL